MKTSPAGSEQFHKRRSKKPGKRNKGTVYSQSGGFFSSLLSDMLSTPFMQKGGAYSYSIYLLHPMLLGLFVRAPLPQTTVAGIFALVVQIALATGTIVVFSAGSYTLIEMPARLWLRAVLSDHRRHWAAAGLAGIVALVVGVGATLGPSFMFPLRATRLDDLGRLKAALVAYRNDHGSYPATPDWRGLFWPGTIAPDWLPGLVPHYLPAAPRDPRGTEIAHAQYIYRSDGQDYKLLSMLPEDCAFTVWLRPDLDDGARNRPGHCISFGYWTEGAARW